MWFLKLNLVGRESTVLSQRAIFLTSDLVPYAEAPLQRFSTSMPETNLLWPKNQLSLEGLSMKRWLSMGFGHLPMKVWQSWHIPSFLPEDQQPCILRIVCFWGFKYPCYKVNTICGGTLSLLMFVSLEKYKLPVFLGLAGK